jgi:predicted nucleic acid-binding protein
MKDSEPGCYQIDANVILRYVAKDNADYFAKSKRILDGMQRGEFVLECDPVTLGEVVWVLKSFYKIANADIAEGLLPIVQSPQFRVPNKSRYVDALTLFATSVKSYGDACCCAAALESCGGRLFSFDHALSGVPGMERLEEPPLTPAP